jgi:hypothetical protein
VTSDVPPREDATRHAHPSGERGLSSHAHPWWLLLLPASFLLHITEEWFAGPGFPAWTARLGGSGIPPDRFIVINAVAWPASAILTILGIALPELAWFLAALATMVSVNAVLHVLGSLATSSYSPGLVTGLLLFLPVGIAALSYCRRVLTPERFLMAAVAGVLVHIGVIVIAFS